MYLKQFILLFCCLFYSLYLNAYDSFNLENAPSSGVGGAYTAFVNDPEVLFYNPAGFADVNENMINIDFNKYFTGFSSETGLGSSDGYYSVDIFSYSLAYIGPVKNLFALGGYVSSLNFSELYTFYTLGIAVSDEIGQYMGLERKLMIGASVKYHQAEYKSTPYNEDYFIDYSSTLTGFGLDTGLLYSVIDDLYMGFSLINLLSSDLGTQFEDKGVTHYKLGFMYTRSIQLIGANQINILMDFDYYEEDFNMALGCELKLTGMGLCVRSGVNLNYVSLGLGYLYNKLISVNYAVNYYISSMDQSGLNHKINLGVRF